MTKEKPQKFEVELYLNRISTGEFMPESKLRKAISDALCLAEEDITVTDVTIL